MNGQVENIMPPVAYMGSQGIKTDPLRKIIDLAAVNHQNKICT